MKNKELFELVQGLQACGNLTGIKFSYAIAKNINTLSTEADLLNKEINKLQDKHAKTDKNGDKIIKNNKVEMKDITKFNKEFEELMDIEVKVDLHKIKQEDLPKEITAQQLSLIFSIVE